MNRWYTGRTTTSKKGSMKCINYKNSLVFFSNTTKIIDKVLGNNQQDEEGQGYVVHIYHGPTNNRLDY